MPGGEPVSTTLWERSATYSVKGGMRVSASLVRIQRWGKVGGILEMSNRMRKSGEGALE